MSTAPTAVNNIAAYT